MADSALRVKLAIQMFEPSAVLPFENSAVGKENSFCFFEFSFGEKGSLEAIFPSHLALSFSVFGQAAIDMVRTQIKKKKHLFFVFTNGKEENMWWPFLNSYDTDTVIKRA